MRGHHYTCCITTCQNCDVLSIPRLRMNVFCACSGLCKLKKRFFLSIFVIFSLSKCRIFTLYTLYIDFLTSNFWRVDFGNLFFVVWRAKKKKKTGGKKHHNPHDSQYYLFKIADIKRASDPRIWCVLLVKDYQILPGYNKWGIRRERNETLVHIPYVHWFVVQSVCSQNVV